MKSLTKLTRQIKTIAISGLMVCMPFFVISQDCDCPSISICGVCAGGLTSLTLQFNGSVASTISVSDQMGVVFSEVVSPGATFTFNGSLANQKFAGPNIELKINGTLDVLIGSACGAAFVGSIFGSFKIIDGESLSGGALCCSAATTETVPPVITNCPADITVDLAAATCSMDVNWIPPEATDNCTLESLIGTHAPGDIFPPGSTQVVYTALDIYGNTSTCAFTVVVEDNIVPVFTDCPSDIIVAANSSCEAVASWTAPTASDNCSVELTSSHNSGSTFPYGETTVTYTATDQKGNVATCTFKINVTNPAKPDITGCPDPITISADENGVAQVIWDEPQASVLCGEVTSTKSHEPGSAFTVGTTTVTYEFKDDRANSSTCSFDVTVLELEVEFTVSQVVTPDGDGIHDTWMIENIENFGSNTVVIVDRWGNKIFQASGYDNENVFWNGTSKSGTTVPTGTYFYTIEVRLHGNIVKKKGYLEVIQ